MIAWIDALFWIFMNCIRNFLFFFRKLEKFMNEWYAPTSRGDKK